MALLPGSPAIGAGDISLIPPGVTMDQRGYPRTSGGSVDIGAFEVQPSPAPVPGPVPSQASAVQLTYGGPGSVLRLKELVSGATPAVTISEPTPGQLWIDLGRQLTFDPTSTMSATGLSYQSGAPETSHFAILDISQANDISTLQADLPGDALTLGGIADASGGLGNVAASAGTITVTGLDTAHAGAGSGNVDLEAAGDLTVAPGAPLDTGMGTIALTAGVNADGTASSTGGELFIGSGATVVSDNTDSSAITLRGSDVDIATGPNAAVVGAHRSAINTTPSATLSGLENPTALAVDAQGNLFVANRFGSTVSVFGPDGSPKAPLTGLEGPITLAFDAHGNLFVGNSNGTVSVFARGSTTPTATLTGVTTPRALAFDAHDNLFVADGSGTTVSVFALAYDANGNLLPGNTTASATLTGLNRPQALAFDAHGNLFVANFGFGGSDTTVSVFALAYDASGNVVLGSTTLATLSGLDGPDALAFDAKGNLYVANALGNTVSEFALAYNASGNLLPGGTTLTSTLTGLNGPIALAFDGDGNLYVANVFGNTPGSSGTTVSVFASGSTPAAPLTGLNGPSALTFDGGNLYVANVGSSGDGTTVSEFALKPAAGGVVVRTAQPDQPINLGAASGTGLVLSDAELAQIFTTGALRIGDASYLGDITVTGDVTRHPGYDTLSLQTTKGTINGAAGATLRVTNLALQAGSGIGTTGRMAIDATNLAFASQQGPIQLSDASSFTLTSVAGLAPSIPGDVFSTPQVGDVYTLLSSGGGVSGQLTYQGQPLAEGATLTLADGNPYQISYQGGTDGHDVTLTRLADPAAVPPPSPGPKCGRAPHRAGLGHEADKAWLFASLFGRYADVLGRAPDPDGGDSWQAAAQGGRSREALADGFLESRPEHLRLVDRY
jgi:sugar lactone lactonase YvrE